MKLNELADIQLIAKTKELVNSERKLNVAIILHIREIIKRKIPIKCGYSDYSRYCEHELGMTRNQAWKRAQVAMTISFRPEVLPMLEKGETTMTNIALIAPKITQANEHILIPGIKGASRREVEFLLSKVDSRGNIDENREPTTRLMLNCNREFMDKLDRAREVMAGRGKNHSFEEVIADALEALLEKRDPMRKAERARARAEKKESTSPGKSPAGMAGASSPRKTDCGKMAEISSPEMAPKDMNEPSSLGKTAKEKMIAVSSSGKTAVSFQKTASSSGKSRPAIPAATLHRIYLRDEGRCTFVGENGKRCDEQGMLETDHRLLWCRGGGHEEDNLRLLCRRHNDFEAERILGREFMEKKRDMASRDRLN